MVGIGVDTESLVISSILEGGLERLAHVILLSLLRKLAVVIAVGRVGLLQALDSSFIAVDDTLEHSRGARALQVRGIDVISIDDVLSVQEKRLMRNQVISRKELELGTQLN